MKKLIALLLILCMCTAMLVSCDMGDVFGVTDNGGSDNDNDDNNDGKNDADAKEDENGGSEQNGGKIPDISDVEKVKGEEITERELQEMKDGYTNYTLVSTIEGIAGTEGTEGTEGESIPFKSISKRDGSAFEMYSYSGDALISGEAGFKIDGKTVYFHLDTETGKWVKDETTSVYIEYPLENMPIELDDLTYDSESGSYVAKGMEAEGQKLDMELKFKDGKCIYCCIEQEIFEKNISMKYAFSDYGTTKVITPDAKDMILEAEKDEENGGAGGGMLPDVNDNIKPVPDNSESKNPDSSEKLPEMNGGANEMYPYPEGDKDQGDRQFEEVTEEKWEYIIKRDCTSDNYTYDTKRYINGEDYGLSFRIAGNRFSMLDFSKHEKNEAVGFVKNGEQELYIYDTKSGEWVLDEYRMISLANPVADLAGFDYSDFKFDENNRIYVTEVDDGDFVVTISIGFLDGHVGFIRTESGDDFIEVYFSDYGKTYVHIPEELGGGDNSDDSVSNDSSSESVDSGYGPSHPAM